MKNTYRNYLFAAIVLFISFLLQCAPLKAQPVTYESWMPLSSGTAGTIPGVRSLAYLDTSFSAPQLLFAGGKFDSAGGIKASHIAQWSPMNSTWSALGSGTNAEVDAITFFNGNIYAGGKFDTAGGIKALHIAMCNNANIWSAVAGGLNGNVYALYVYRNALYVGGDFTTANGIKVNRVAKWDGAAWDSVGAGFDSNTVYALASYNDTLYAGGSFTKSGGQTVNYIARWDGSKWQPVGSGANGTVYALDSCNFFQTNSKSFFVGGAFTMFNGFTANHIVSYDSAKWDSLGSGTNDTVRALTQCNGTFPVIINGRVTSLQQTDLMAGGNFSNEGKIHSPYLGYWDGKTWDSLGYTNKTVYALTSNGNLAAGINYVGGDFDSTYGCYMGIGWVKASHVAQLQYMIGTGINELSNNGNISIYPNPSNGKFSIEVKSEGLRTKNTVEVYNMLGEKVYTTYIVHYPLSIDISAQPPGIYLCRIIDDKGDIVGSRKIIIQP